MEELDTDKLPGDPMVVGRTLLAGRDAWIAEEFASIEKELGRMRGVPRGKKQPAIWMETPAEVFKAFELRIVRDRAEARKLLGLKTVRTAQPEGLRRAQAARKPTAKPASPRRTTTTRRKSR